MDKISRGYHLRRVLSSIPGLLEMEEKLKLIQEAKASMIADKFTSGATTPKSRELYFKSLKRLAEREEALSAELRRLKMPHSMSKSSCEDNSMMNKISVEERISRMTVKDLYSAMVKEGCSLKDLEKRALASLSEITDYWGDVLAGQRDLGEDVGMASGRLSELLTGKPRPDVRGEGYYRHLNAQRIRMANRNMQARLKLLRAIENSKMDVSGIGNALFGNPGQ